MRTSHKYRGKWIFPVELADKAKACYRWYVQAIHSQTGLRYDSDLCPHYFTLKEAKKAIDDQFQANEQ